MFIFVVLDPNVFVIFNITFDYKIVRVYVCSFLSLYILTSLPSFCNIFFFYLQLWTTNLRFIIVLQHNTLKDYNTIQNIQLHHQHMMTWQILRRSILDLEIQRDGLCLA